MKRFYALQLVKENRVQLVKALDGDTILGEKAFEWETQRCYRLKIQVSGKRIKAWVDQQLLFDVRDENRPLLGGGVAYVVDQGHLSSQAMRVHPISSNAR